MPALGGQFVGTGGFGSQRFANALGQTGADFQANLTGQQNKSLADAYQSALTGAYNEGQLQNAVAQTQGNLAGKQQELGLKGASALTAAGAAQQQYTQSVLDYPLTNALNSMKVLSGLTIPQGTVKTGPGSRDQNGMSDLQKAGVITSFLSSPNFSKLSSAAQNAWIIFNSSGDSSKLTGFTNNDIQTLRDQGFDAYNDEFGNLVIDT
jgi:hypothetical protein